MGWFSWDGTVFQRDSKIVVRDVAATRQNILELSILVLKWATWKLMILIKRFAVWWKNLHKEEDYIKGTLARCKYEIVDSLELL